MDSILPPPLSNMCVREFVQARMCDEGLVLCVCVQQLMFLRGSMESIRCTLAHPKEPDVCSTLDYSEV